MTLFQTLLLLTTIFVYKVNKAITNEQTREKLSKVNLRFNNFLYYLRDTSIMDEFAKISAKYSASLCLLVIISDGIFRVAHNFNVMKCRKTRSNSLLSKCQLTHLNKQLRFC
jgi:hypothetical protein